MHKEKATRFFAKALAEADHIYFIDDDNLEGYIEKNAQEIHPVILEKDFNAIMIEGRAYHSSYHERYDEGKSVEIKIEPKYPDEVLTKGGSFCGVENKATYSVVLCPSRDFEHQLTEFHAENTVIQNVVKIAKFIGANYFFVKVSKRWDAWYQRTVELEGLPYAVIRENEVDLLRELYKGDLNGEVLEAAQALDIEKMLEVDYKTLAKTNPEKFCEYFEAVSDEKRKNIITDVWELLKKNMNPEIKDVLRKKEYEPLIKEVGRNKI